MHKSCFYAGCKKKPFFYFACQRLAAPVLTFNAILWINLFYVSFKCSIETAGAGTATPTAFYYSYSLQMEPETACCNTTDIVTLEQSAGAHHF